MTRLSSARHFTRFLKLLLFLFLFLVLHSSQARAATVVSGTLSQDTTWDAAGSPYILNGNVIVASGSTLAIETGAVVKGRYSYSKLTVQGRLEATTALFTSYKNDILEDNNGDGAASSPVAGDWHGIEFMSTGSGFLNASTIEWAGNSSYATAAVSVLGATSSIEIINSGITNSARYGLYAGIGSTPPSISGSNFTANYSGGVYSEVPLETLSNNIFTGNMNGAAAKLPASIGTNVFNNQYSGNRINGMYLTGSTIDRDINWPASNSPYIANVLTVNPTFTLNIANGAVVKFYASVSADGTHTGTGGKLDIRGTLQADGAVFTSIFDD